LRQSALALICLVSAAFGCTSTSPVYTAVATPKGITVGTQMGSTTSQVFSCNDILACLNACSTTDTACPETCDGEGTTAAQSDFASLEACIASACPSSAGGVCATEDAACDSCISTAEASGGGCATQLATCQNNTSAAGGTLSCSGINTCLNACAASDTTCENNCVADGTAAAQNLFENTENCLAGACPDGSSGVCATETSACNSCLSSAEATTGVCGGAVTSCENDASGTGGTAANGCNALLTCLNNCAAGNTTCDTTCQNAASSAAVALYQTASTCMLTACPETSGGICATETTACTTCLTNAQDSGGTCFTSVSACEAN